MKPGRGAALLVVAAGVAAALHVGKLPPAIPVLQRELGITLVQAGFLLSLVQLAGMALGLLLGAAAERLGLRRTMAGGLLLLALASLLGAGARSAGMLLILRAVEGLGFLLASLPAPALIRRLVQGAALPRMLGWWGAYMPFGTAGALLLGPWVMAAVGWPGWWLLTGGVSLVMGLVVLLLPRDCDTPAGGPPRATGGRLRRTIASRGPWLAALPFACYSAQWLSVIGFLPTIYAQAGLAATIAGPATALAAAVNAVGNIASGRLLAAGVRPHRLLQAGFGAMALGTWLAFGGWTSDGAPLARFAGILLFSSAGGLVPGTLFSLAVRLAPDDGTVSSTVGWMQQWSAFGQFTGPPLVAWLAARSGGWSPVWWCAAALALLGMVLARAIGRRLGAIEARQPPAAGANS